MTSLTLLGATGGAGTTTVAAITAVRLAARQDERPATLAVDAQALGARLGGSLGAPGRRGHAVIDGARWTGPRAAAALDDGVLVIVSAGTTAGDAVAAELVARTIALAGSSVRDRVWLLRTGAHGRSVRSSVHGDRVLEVPFDAALAAVPVIPDALPHLRRSTASAIDRWVAAVRTVLP